jgi:photosystem II stability/assembly factor-like uncharacterized protein
MSWSSLANNQTISFNNLQDGVNTGQLRQKTTIPVSNEQITKAEANTYVNIDTAFPSYAAKTSNQLVVKSNINTTVDTNTIGNDAFLFGIANNQTTSSPIQLISGADNTGLLTRGAIYRSTDYGVTYSNVFTVSDILRRIKFMPGYRHASYLTVPPFVSVGEDGRIVTNSNTAATSWVTVSSPTTQDLYDISFNSLGVGIIVGDRRIIKTNTNYRINSWSIVNSVSSIWRAVASDTFSFVAVGNNSSIITSTALGSTWTVRSMPPLTPSKQLRGVTYHTDGYWYVVGFDTANSSLPYMMRSNNTGVSWEAYLPTGDAFIGSLNNINSIGGRLVISGNNYQYQILNNVCTRYSTINFFWEDNVGDANSNGFDMAGLSAGTGAYSNF